MKFVEFRTAIDREIKQFNYDGITYGDNDNYKAVHKDEIKIWLNESLLYMSTLNNLFWTRIAKILIPTKTDTIIIPDGIQALFAINVNNKWERVAMGASNNAFSYYWDGSNQIFCDTPVDKGSVKIEAIFSPSLVEDDDSVIDCPIQWIRLLKLLVLNKYTGRDDIKNSIWYSELLSLKKEFKEATPRVHITGIISPKVSF